MILEKMLLHLQQAHKTLLKFSDIALKQKNIKAAEEFNKQAMAVFEAKNYIRKQIIVLVDEPTVENNRLKELGL